MADPMAFDPSPYLRPPRFDVRQGVALAIALLSALPAGAPEGVKRTARDLRKATVALQKAWSRRERAASKVKPGEKAKADRRIDAAWGALKMRLEAFGMLPLDTHPRAVRAQKLNAVLFPKGMGFLASQLDSEWSASEQILKRIADDELAVDIDAIAGPEFLAEVQAAHRVYGVVLGITQAIAPPEDVQPLLELLREVAAAMSDYTLQVLATVHRSKPETIAAVQQALHPLDRYRERAARRTPSKGGEAEPEEAEPEVGVDTPVPEIPA